MPASETNTERSADSADELAIEQLEYSLSFLADWERLVSVEFVGLSTVEDPTRIKKSRSAVHQMQRLSKAEHSMEIGLRGAAMAAVALNQTEQREEFLLYETLFGRDSLRVAQNVMELYPKLARTTLVALAEHQGTVRDEMREEQPGKIIHEYRDPEFDPIAQRLTEEKGWGWPYYGAVDSTIHYIHALRAYIQACDDGLTDETADEFLAQPIKADVKPERSMANSLEGAVHWLERKLDENPQHIVEYQRVNRQGIENQVWKDSWDSYFHDDGSLASHEKGIASIEVQGLAYDALLDAAELYDQRGGLDTEAARLRQRADDLRAAVHELFWVDDDGGYFALGTDRDEQGNLRQLKIKTSNMGHVLNSRLLEGDDPRTVERREALVEQLFTPEMQNVSGIRTLASDEARFKPGAYHNGSVWLWDTNYIAQGLERHGYLLLADDIRKKVSNVVEATSMFPEFVRGDFAEEPRVNQHIIDIYDEELGKGNRIEQPPQQVQAWTVSAILYIKHHVVLHQAQLKQHLASDSETLDFEQKVRVQLSAT